MKRRLISALVAFVFGISSALAQSAAEESLYRQLAGDETNAVPALEQVLKTPDDRSAAILLVASRVAFHKKRIEDAGFLYYIMRLRLRFDRDLFPPVGTGGDSPMLVFGAAESEMGPSINPAIAAEPKIYADVLARVKSWKPNVATNYEPGWDYSKKGDLKAAQTAFEESRKKLIDHMTGFSTLLQNTNYFTAFKIGQNYNLKFPGDSGRPSKEAYESAVLTMEGIEKATGIEGAASVARKVEAEEAARAAKLKQH